MNTLGHIAVYPRPRPEIARLTELAYNLWWSWNPAAQALYEESIRLSGSRSTITPSSFCGWSASKSSIGPPPTQAIWPVTRLSWRTSMPICIRRPAAPGMRAHTRRRTGR